MCSGVALCSELKIDDRGPQVPARVRDPLQLALGRRGGREERREVEWMGCLTRPITAVNLPAGNAMVTSSSATTADLPEP